MKVLMVTDNLRRGGKERRMIELLKGLKVYPDVEVSLLLLANEIDYPEIHEICPNLHILERTTKKDLGMFRRVYRLLKTLQPDIVHSWGSLPSVYLTPAVSLLGIKFVNAMITNANPHMKWNEANRVRARLTFPFSQMIIGNSNAGLAAYNAPTDRSHCVYNGFDFRRVRGLQDVVSVREQYGIRTKKVVGMIGAFHKRKDYQTYLKAAIAIAEAREDVSFMAVGKGDLLAESEAMIPQALKDRILFPGMVQQVESLINTWDLGVLMTNAKVHGEGISNAILEYMALGKPVVASIGGGTPEIVKPDENGFLVPPFAVAALQDRISYLLDHPIQAQQMGFAGLQLIKNQFNLAHMAEQYYRLYRQLHSPQPFRTIANS